MKRFLAGLLVLAAGFLPVAAAPAAANSDPNAETYRLMVRDQVSIAVFGEDEMGALVTIDLNGSVRIPLLEDIQLLGLTAREAEKKLEQLYVERELLKKPTVTVRIVGYAKREVMILGAVRNPGALGFPPEIAAMDIVEAISKAGGFTGIAITTKVRVMRRNARGEETTKFLNVRDMMERAGSEHFQLLPGDQVFVDDRFI